MASLKILKLFRSACGLPFLVIGLGCLGLAAFFFQGESPIKDAPPPFDHAGRDLPYFRTNS